MASSRETAVYFDPQGGEQATLLKSILVRMGARIKNIAPEDTNQTLGYLLGRKGFDVSEETEVSALAERMLVLDGFTDKRLDILLREMRQNAVSIPYKAIVTETNLNWRLCDLYKELEAEREALSK